MYKRQIKHCAAKHTGRPVKSEAQKLFGLNDLYPAPRNASAIRTPGTSLLQDFEALRGDRVLRYTRRAERDGYEEKSN